MYIPEPVEKYFRPVRLRPYTDGDFEVCRAIYISNEGKFFPSTCRAEFEEELRHPRSLYLVMESAGVIVALGGICFFKGHNQIALSSGMVDRSRHREGFGTTLLFARLALIDSLDSGCGVILAVSSESFDFYRKFGFQPYAKAKDANDNRFAWMGRHVSFTQFATIRQMMARNGIMLPTDFEIPLRVT